MKASANKMTDEQFVWAFFLRKCWRLIVCTKFVLQTCYKLSPERTNEKAHCQIYHLGDFKLPRLWLWLWATKIGFEKCDLKRSFDSNSDFHYLGWPSSPICYKNVLTAESQSSIDLVLIEWSIWALQSSTFNFWGEKLHM